MTNIQPFDNPQYYFKTEDVQRIFEKYNLRPEHPIDYAKFVQDLHEICTVSYVLSELPQVPHHNLNKLNFNINYNDDGTTNIPKK